MLWCAALVQWPAGGRSGEEGDSFQNKHGAVLSHLWAVNLEDHQWFSSTWFPKRCHEESLEGLITHTLQPFSYSLDSLWLFQPCWGQEGPGGQSWGLAGIEGVFGSLEGQWVLWVNVDLWLKPPCFSCCPLYSVCFKCTYNGISEMTAMLLNRST